MKNHLLPQRTPVSFHTLHKVSISDEDIEANGLTKKIYSSPKNRLGPHFSPGEENPNRYWAIHLRWVKSPRGHTNHHFTEQPRCPTGAEPGDDRHGTGCGSP